MVSRQYAQLQLVPVSLGFYPLMNGDARTTPNLTTSYNSIAENRQITIIAGFAKTFLLIVSYVGGTINEAMMQKYILDLLNKEEATTQTPAVMKTSSGVS